MCPARARARGIPHFHIFGEVATWDYDPALQAGWTRRSGLPAVLDFAFARAANDAAGGKTGTGELARMVKRLVEILTPEQLDHAKVAGCNPEVYAIELLHLWREKDRDRRTMAESSSDPDLSFPGRIKSFRDLKSGQF